MATRQFCTFVLGDFYFGVDVTRVQEVFHYQDMTEIPLADPVIEGLINLRGQIIAAVDLRHLLEMEPRPEGMLPSHIVVRDAEGAVSFLVDEIGDELTVSDEVFEGTPETFEGAARELVHGAYKLDDQYLLVLDIDRVLSVQA